MSDLAIRKDTARFTIITSVIGIIMVEPTIAFVASHTSGLVYKKVREGALE